MAVSIDYRDQGRVVRMGILGFSLGLGLAGLTAAGLAGKVDAGSYRSTMAIIYGLVGLLVGTLLGISLRSRAGVLVALFSAVGMGIGYYLSQMVIEQLGAARLTPYLGPELGPLAFPFVQFVFMGTLTGTLVGLAQARGDQILRGALAGMLGLGLAFLVQAASYGPLLSILFQPFFDWISGGSIALLLPMMISWAVAGGLGGVVAGAVFGEAMA